MSSNNIMMQKRKRRQTARPVRYQEDDLPDPVRDSITPSWVHPTIPFNRNLPAASVHSLKEPRPKEHQLSSMWKDGICPYPVEEWKPPQLEPGFEDDDLPDYPSLIREPRSQSPSPSPQIATFSAPNFPSGDQPARTKPNSNQPKSLQVQSDVERKLADGKVKFAIGRNRKKLPEKGDTHWSRLDDSVQVLIVRNLMEVLKTNFAGVSARLSLTSHDVKLFQEGWNMELSLEEARKQGLNVRMPVDLFYSREDILLAKDYLGRRGLLNCEVIDRFDRSWGTAAGGYNWNRGYPQNNLNYHAIQDKAGVRNARNDLVAASRGIAEDTTFSEQLVQYDDVDEDPDFGPRRKKMRLPAKASYPADRAVVWRAMSTAKRPRGGNPRGKRFSNLRQSIVAGDLAMDMDNSPRASAMPAVVQDSFHVPHRTLKTEARKPIVFGPLDLRGGKPNSSDALMRNDEEIFGLKKMHNFKDNRKNNPYMGFSAPLSMSNANSFKVGMNAHKESFGDDGLFGGEKPHVDGTSRTMRTSTATFQHKSSENINMLSGSAFVSATASVSAPVVAGQARKYKAGGSGGGGNYKMVNVDAHGNELSVLATGEVVVKPQVRRRKPENSNNNLTKTKSEDYFNESSAGAHNNMPKVSQRKKTPPGARNTTVGNQNMPMSFSGDHDDMNEKPNTMKPSFGDHGNTNSWW